MANLRCMNPRCGVWISGAKHQYWGEALCSDCWKELGYEIWTYRSAKRSWDYSEKQERTASIPFTENYAHNLARQMAAGWSRVRLYLRIDPEFPAGLAYFLKETFVDPNRPQDILVEIIAAIREMIAAEDYDNLATMLSRVANDRKMSTDRIIASLRGAYTARRKIPGWDDVIWEAKQTIMNRGEPADKLLHGLG